MKAPIFRHLLVLLLVFIFQHTLLCAQPIITNFGNISNTFFSNQKIALGGCYAGGPDRITITGSGFTAGTTVSVNGISAPTTIVNTGLLISSVPYYSPTITGKNISGLIRVANGLGFDISALPLEVIFCIDFQFGSPSLAPGTVVRVDGGDLDKVTSISIAGLSSSFSYNSVENKLFVKVPPTLPGGSFDVIFSQGAYTQIPTFPFTFTKAEKPIVSAVTSSAGVGGEVLIQGQHFAVPSQQNAIKVDGSSVSVPYNSFSSSAFSFTLPAYIIGGEVELTNQVTGLSTIYSKGIVRSSQINSIPTFSGSAFQTQTLAGLDNMQGLKSTDLNTDGKADLIWVDMLTRKVVAYLNTSPPSFALPTYSRVELATLPTTLGAGIDLKLVDINADGKIDITVSDFNTEIYIIPNISTATGTMLFGNLVIHTLAGVNTSMVSPTFLSWGDLDTDGKPDLVSTYLDLSTRYISISRNQSETPRITTQSLENNMTVRTLTGGESAQSLIIDLDGDGKQEIVLSDNGINARFAVYSFIGMTGNITDIDLHEVFSYQAAPSVGTRYLNGWQSTDINLDGKLDLIVLDNIDSQLLIFQNTSTGIGQIGFAPPIAFSLTPGGVPILAKAANIDGELVGNTPKVDIAVLQVFASGAELVLFQNVHSGANISLASLAAPYLFSVSGVMGSTYGLDIADVNNDGLTDVVFLGPDQHIFTLINTACPSHTINWPDYGTVSYEQSVGGSILIEASVSGLNLDYAWYANISGAIQKLTDDGVFSGTTTTGLSITGVPSSLSGATLFVVATPLLGNCLAFTSPGIATLQVIPCYAPAVILQPNSVLGCLSGTTNISVVVTGTGLSFQWQEFNGVIWQNLSDIGPYTGVTTSLLGFTDPPALLSGRAYRVLVSGICGTTVTSSGASLILNTGIDIVSQPVSPLPVCVNSDTLRFSVSALGLNLSYQWQYFDGNTWLNFIPSSTVIDPNSPEFRLIHPASSLDRKFIRVVITDNCSNTAISDQSAQIFLLQPPSIITQPSTPFGVCVGTGSLIFNAQVQGDNLQYQWQIRTLSGWTNIALSPNFSNVNTDNLLVNNPPYAFNGAQVRLSISGSCLSGGLLTDSSAYIIVFNTSPDIVLQPKSDTLCDGAEQTILVVSALGSNLSYQWQRFDSGSWQLLPQNTFFEGLNNDTLVLTNPTLEINGQAFRVQVTGSCSATPSFSDGLASLTIYPKPQVQFIQGQSCDMDSNLLVIENSPYYTSYQWTYSNSPIVYDTLTTYKLIADGSYAVYVNSNKNCASNSTEFLLPIDNRNPALLSLGDTVLQAPSAQKYQWYVYDKVLQGDTLRTLAIRYNGIYKVDLTFDDNCFTTSQSYTFNRTDFEDAARFMVYIQPNVVKLESGQVIIFPNPTTDKVVFEGAIKRPICSVFDGKYAKLGDFDVYPSEKGSFTIDFKKLGFSKGLYFINVDNVWYKLILH